MNDCPHGDPTCPCPDGLCCHYEGPDAMACPTLVLAQKDEDGSWWSVGMDGVLRPAGAPHCHVEGCGWRVEVFGIECAPEAGAALVETVGCGLLRIAPETTMAAGYAIGCGAVRYEAHRSG